MIFTAEVTFYDSIDEETVQENLIIADDNFTSAAEKIENFYGEELEAFTLHLVEPDYDFITVPKEISKAIEQRVTI